MTITLREPLTMSEVAVMVGNSDKSIMMKDFIKNFKITSVEKAKEMKRDLAKLEMIKLKDYHIVKIVDFMPESPSELGKVIIDTSLDSEEIEKILGVVKKY